MSDLETLTILPVNKTVVFYSPIEGKDVLVRTGTIAEGSCFFHALLHAYSKDYISMNENGRKKFVKKLRSSIAVKIDKSKWESLSNGLIAKISFQENVNIILSDFYKYISKGGGVGRTKSVRKVVRSLIKDEKVDIETYKIIMEMIPLDKGFEKTILPSAYEKCEEDDITNCKNIVVKQSVKYYKKEFEKLQGQLEDERVEYYLNKLESMVQEVLDEAENSAYTDYIQSINDSSMEVDSSTIGLISEKFNRDIYFIDARTRMPYRDVNLGNICKRKSIIVMWTGGCHYEIVGKLLAGNRIQREFDFKDSLIKIIHTYLYKPEKISGLYPNLIPYLPKDVRKKLKLDISDSEGESSNESSKSSKFEESSAYEKSGSDEDEPLRESKKRSRKNLFD
jgi:hypothetical protein